MPPNYLLSLIMGVFLVNGSPGEQPAQENSPIFLIEAPESRISPTAQTVLNLDSGEMKLILVHILRPEADKINYGEIYPSLNGAAAARVSEFRASERGKLVQINLKTRPGFHLLPGPNTVKVLATDQFGREFRASFILHTPAGVCSGGGRARVLNLQDVLDLLRAGVSNARLTQLVHDCGVEFRSSPETDQRLRDAGAEETLIEAIRNPMETKPAAARHKGLRATELEELLRAGVSNDRLIELVRERGVVFQLTGEIEQKLKEAGANRKLLDTIRSTAEAATPPDR